MTTHTQDGVTYVERDYKCLDCDWTWTQTTIKGADAPACPNCRNIDRNRFVAPGSGEKIKTKVRGKTPKKKEKVPGMPAYNPKGQIAKQAAGLAYDECQKQGFTDMIDHGLRNGDIAAPKLTSLVAQVQDNVFKGGWTGGTAPAYAGRSPVEHNGKEVMGEFQRGLAGNQIPDLIKNAKRIE